VWNQCDFRYWKSKNHQEYPDPNAIKKICFVIYVRLFLDIPGIGGPFGGQLGTAHDKSFGGFKHRIN